MITEDGIKIRGWVVAELRDEHGNLKGYCEAQNIVTDIGDNALTTRLIAGVNSNGVSAVAQPTGMQIGSTGTAVAKSGAGAGMVAYLIGQAFDATYPTQTTAAGSGAVITYKVTYAAGVGTTASPILEAVITNNATVTTTSTAANTLARVLLTGIGSKGATDTLTVTWTVTVN